MGDQEKSAEDLEMEKQQIVLLEDLKKTGWKPESLPEFQGIIKDMQSERQSKQLTEDRLISLEGEKKLLSDELASKKDKEDDEFEGRNDDEVLTIAEAKKMLQKGLQQVKGNDAERQKADMHQRLISSEEAAVKELTTEKMGEGLDYLSVIKNGYSKMVKKNPKYQEVMINSQDPAKSAYEIGLMDESIREIVEKQKNITILDNLKKAGKVVPKGGGSITEYAAVEEDDFNKIIEMPESELMKVLKDLES